MNKLTIQDYLDIIRLHSVKGIGDTSLQQVLQKGIQIKEIIAEVKRGRFFSIRPAQAFQLMNEMQAEKILEMIQREQVEVLVYGYPGYPQSLMEIEAPPPILYVKGHRGALDAQSLAIIGTRRYSAYGEQVIQRFLPALISHQIVVVSGLAIGIDTLAHQTTVDHHGVTVGVLGSGIDIVAPIQNQRLGAEIIQAKGCLISEFPVGTAPATYTFPRRNRLIAGLAQAVLVVEAGIKSGTHITVNYCLEMGKEVYVIPGSIFNHASQGTNHLIKLGARMVTEPAEVVADFGLTDNRESSSTLRQSYHFSNKVEEAIFGMLAAQPKYIDEICSEVAEQPERILMELTNMELKGYVQRIEGDYFIQTPR